MAFITLMFVVLYLYICTFTTWRYAKKDTLDIQCSYSVVFCYSYSKSVENKELVFYDDFYLYSRFMFPVGPK